MKVAGKGHVQFFTFEDEGPHPAGKDDWWNESVWLQFADSDAEIYGAIRIGHQPNLQGGQTSIWSMIGTPDWIYKRDGLNPLTDADRITNGFGANGTHKYSADDKGGHWSIRDEDIEVDLLVEDYHPPIGYTPGGLMENVAKNHFEASGKITGTVTIKGKRYELKNGMASRDHSWGVRFWHLFRAHRFTAATFGPDFSCNAICFLDETDRLAQWGYIVRGDTIYPAKEVDVIAYMEADSVSNRGGAVRFTMHDGEEIVVELKPVNMGMVSRQHTTIITDTICWAETDGRTGVGVFETNTNPQGGTIIPSQRGLMRAIIENGISPAGAPFDGFYPRAKQ